MSKLRVLCLFIWMLPVVAFAADDPLAGLRDLVLSGRHKEARVQLEKARETFIAQTNAPGKAATLMLLGATDSSLGDVQTARKELEEAATEFTALGDSFTAWLSLAALAQLEKGEGRLAEAIAIHDRSLALLEKAADPRAQFSMETLKILGPVFGVQTEMLGPLQQFPALVKPMMLGLATVLTHDAYGGTLIEAGALEKADEQLALAKSSAAMYGGLLDTPIETHLGDLRRAQWRLDEARESYLKAIQGGELTTALSLGDPHAVVKVLGKLAELEVFTGRVEEALQYSDRALKLIRELKDPKREADVLQDRANLLVKAGRFDDAVPLFAQALKVAVANSDRFRQASIHSDLGALHLFQGTYGTAASHLEKAIDLYQQLKLPNNETPLWITLAEVQMQLDLQHDATSSLDNARALALKSNFKLAGAMVNMLASAKKMMAGQGSLTVVDESIKAWLEMPESREMAEAGDALRAAQDLLHLGSRSPGQPSPVTQSTARPPLYQAVALFLEGKILFDRGDREGARATWTQALGTNPNNDIRAGLLAMLGASHWLDGHQDEAIRNFTKAAAAIQVSADDVKVEEMLASYLGSNRRVYYELLIDMLVKNGNWREAFAQAERARARAFLQMVGNHRFNAERGADPRLVREAETLRNDIATRERQLRLSQGSDVARLAADLERAQQQYKTILTRVKVSNPEYESLTNIEPLRLEDVRRELPADTALVSYFVSTRGIHAWVVDREDAHYVHLTVDPDGLRRITCWAGSLSGRGVQGEGTNAPCDDGSAAEDAFDQLFAPLLGFIRQPRLLLVPHGVLHYVPFAALRNRATHRSLIDDFTITYAPSASALRFLRAKESAMDGGALILGDPKTSLPGLPGAAKEAAAVAQVLGATAYLGTDAREALLNDLHGTVDLVHLAAHGIYDPANPMFSRLVLASDGTHDGNLTVEKILASVDLTGVNLVVLSACQSAVGARSGGDEVVGLTRALLYAGTPGVISTLWNIDDTTSAELMEQFYRGLASGASVADALRQAQLVVKEHAPDPRYWAAFLLTGDPQGRWKRTN
ncbi:MAG: CHAT domain-containing tetratricopeptide repeat protein [Acidobacteriota bacterium]